MWKCKEWWNNTCDLVQSLESAYPAFCKFIDSICPKNQPGKNKESNKVMYALGKDTLEMAEVQRFAKRNISKNFYIGWHAKANTWESFQITWFDLLLKCPSFLCYKN